MEGNWNRVGIVGGLVLASVLLVANVAAPAGDGCAKLCGCGDVEGDFYHRDGCGGQDDCHVVECPNHVPGCGYSDNHNDNCDLHLNCDWVAREVGCDWT